MSADSAEPITVGPYAPIVVSGDWLICSGQLGVTDGELVAGGVKAELTCAIANLERLLAGQGATLRDVVKTTVFLTDMADFSAMNESYVAAFSGHRPARSAVAVVGLPLGAHVEIEAWARQTAATR